MRKTLLLLLTFFVLIDASSQTLRSTSIVKDFFSKVNIYASDDDPAVHKQILTLCTSGFRISDQLAQENSRIQSTSIDLASYLLLLREVKAQYNLSYVKEVNIKNERVSNNSGMKVVEIKCSVNSSKFRYSSLHDLVYINSDGKVVAIGDYDTDTRKSTNNLQIQSFSFSKKDVSGNYSSELIKKAYQRDISYLYCEVDMISSQEKDFIFCSKIIKPNGAMIICNGCTNLLPGYTLTSQKITVPSSKTYHYCIGYGNSDGSLWDVGTYRWEIWAEQKLLGSSTFEILPPKQHNALEIKNIEFVGLDKNGYELTPSVQNNGVLSSYQKIKGVKVKLYYAKLSEDISIRVYFNLDEKNLNYNYNNTGYHTLKKNTTQDYINIMYNKMPKKGKIRIEITAYGNKQNKTETKIYSYTVRMDN